MSGQHGHNTRPHARLPPTFLGMDATMHMSLTTKLKVALIRQLSGSLMCLANFFDKVCMDVCTTALTDDRSTDAGIECLYCI